MFKEIINILTPKGELTGIPFIINCLILRIVVLILNYIGMFFYFNKYADVPAIKFLEFVIVILIIFFMLIVTFNYKRRLLNITGNLAVSIILSIILAIVIDVILALVYVNIAVLFANLILIPITLGIIPSKNCAKKEYWQTFFKRVNNFIKNPITIFVLVMLISDILLVKYSIYKNTKISKIVPSEHMEKLVINPISAYSGKTKAEILDIRKNYVKTSMFNSNEYEPSEKVFGQIIDKKPWWGIDHIICTDRSIPKHDIGNGNSEESRYLNNPNLLVGVQMSKSFIKSNDLKDFCEDKSLRFIPTLITYDKQNKLIIIEYNASKSFTYKINKKFIEFLLVGLNARDFGYNWVYVSNSNNIKFLPASLDMRMVNEKPQRFLDYIHLGKACQIEEGCNNSSPYQPEMAFSFSNIPADMTISLWKNKPIYKNQPADIYLKMIFK